MPLHLFLPDKIHHSYLVNPNSNASTSVRYFLALQGTVLVITSSAFKNSIQTPTVALSMLDYALCSSDSLSHQRGRCGLEIHIGTWTISYFIIPSVKHRVKNSISVQVTRYDQAFVWEGQWVPCLTAFREEGQAKWNRDRMAGTCSDCDSASFLFGSICLDFSMPHARCFFQSEHLITFSCL